MPLTGTMPPPLPNTDLPPLRVGLVHGHLAARSKWPDVAPSGRPLDWVVMDAPDTRSGLVDLWVVGTQANRSLRLDTARCLIGSASPVPTLILLPPREDMKEWLDLGAEGYHETSSSAALLGQRIEALIPAPKSHSDHLPVLPALAEAEALFWQSTFDMAGAGLITGRSTRFMEAVEEAARKGPMRSRDEAIQRARDILGSITWELNNPEAKALLDLRTPVSLDCGFTGRLTPLQPQAFLADLIALRQGGQRASGDILIRDQEGHPRYLSLELSLPESAEDTLLLTLLDISGRIELEGQLREHVQHLEERVEARTLEIRQAHAKLTTEGKQRQRLVEQVRQNLVHITQGVMSAKQILEVALPGKDELQECFPDSMLIERPRDILGGDFLFLGTKGPQHTLALIDSTGHGVPGSMVALLGSLLLNRAFVGLDAPRPGDILSAFQAGFDERMNHHSDTPQMFGFDGGILTYDADAGQVHFAGARGDLFLVRDGETTLYRGTRESIELLELVDGEVVLPEFKEHTLDVLPGDQLYMATDGVRDQFGGPHNRKLGRKRLADLLQEHAHLPMGEREQSIQQALLMWKGGNAKVDDATLVGIDIPLPQED